MRFLKDSTYKMDEKLFKTFEQILISWETAHTQLHEINVKVQDSQQRCKNNKKHIYAAQRHCMPDIGTRRRKKCKSFICHKTWSCCRNVHPFEIHLHLCKLYLTFYLYYDDAFIFYIFTSLPYFLKKIKRSQNCWDVSPEKKKKKDITFMYVWE